MIILRLDRVMADRKMSLNELSEKVGVANVNLSKIKTGKISAIRFSTLDAIAKRLTASRGIFSNIGEKRARRAKNKKTWQKLLAICARVYYNNSIKTEFGAFGKGKVGFGIQFGGERL